MSKPTKTEIAERDASRAHLRAHLKPGDKIYAILRHRSASGMRREISLFYHDGAELVGLDYHASRAIGCRIGSHGGIVADGCGMDMGFQLVYLLGGHLWPDGTPEPHGRRNGKPDSSGGYALKLEWL